MSRSRHYPGRRRHRNEYEYYSREFRTESARNRGQDWDTIDGVREYEDLYDNYLGLDYSWTWKHKEEAKYRNHKTRGARLRDRKNSGTFQRAQVLAAHLRSCGLEVQILPSDFCNCCYKVLYGHKSRNQTLIRSRSCSAFAVPTE